jgi:UrcA family protein
MNSLIKTRSNLAKFIVVAGFLGLGTTAVVRTALASEPMAPTPTQSQVVRYADLNVATEKGAKILYLRIRYAAETLCESTATWGKKQGDVCVNKAVNDAVARVDAPLLTQYSRLRSKDKAGLVQLAKTS